MALHRIVRIVGLAQLPIFVQKGLTHRPIRGLDTATWGIWPSPSEQIKPFMNIKKSVCRQIGSFSGFYLLFLQAHVTLFACTVLNLNLGIRTFHSLNENFGQIVLL